MWIQFCKRSLQGVLLVDVIVVVEVIADVIVVVIAIDEDDVVVVVVVVIFTLADEDAIDVVLFVLDVVYLAPVVVVACDNVWN